MINDHSMWKYLIQWVGITRYIILSEILSEDQIISLQTDYIVRIHEGKQIWTELQENAIYQGDRNCHYRRYDVFSLYETGALGAETAVTGAPETSSGRPFQHATPVLSVMRQLHPTS